MPNKRNLKDYGFLVLKGMGMGAADVVPGVSGGTIAFIVGIYEELIDSIKSINGTTLKQLFTGKIAAFWKGINANSCFLSWVVLVLVYSRWRRSLRISWCTIRSWYGLFSLVWCWPLLGSSLRISGNGTGRRS